MKILPAPFSAFPERHWLASAAPAVPFSLVQLLLHMDNVGGAILDSSQNNFAPSATQGTPVQSATQAKFGAGSLFVNDTNDGLWYNSALFNPAGQYCCWEFFIFVGPGLANAQVIQNRIYFGGGSFYIGLGYAGAGLGWGIETSTFGFNDLVFFAMPQNQWVHFAFQFDQTLGAAATCSVYKDGALLATKGTSGLAGGVVTAQLAPGTGGSFGWNVYTDEVRITAGNQPVYTGPFTPPTAPFPNS